MAEYITQSTDMFELATKSDSTCTFQTGVEAVDELIQGKMRLGEIFEIAGFRHSAKTYVTIFYQLLFLSILFLVGAFYFGKSIDRLSRYGGFVQNLRLQLFGSFQHKTSIQTNSSEIDVGSMLFNISCLILSHLGCRYLEFVRKDCGEANLGSRTTY